MNVVIKNIRLNIVDDTKDKWMTGFFRKEPTMVEKNENKGKNTCKTQVQA